MAALISLGHGRRIAVQNVAYTSSSAGATNPFSSETQQVRLCASSTCLYRVSDDASAATAADVLLPAETIEYVMVTPGQKIAAIEAATNGLITGTAGTLNVTELG